MKSIEKTKRKYYDMNSKDIHLIKSIKKENNFQSRLKLYDNSDDIFFVENGSLVDAKIFDYDILLLIGSNLYLRQDINKNSKIQSNGLLVSSNVTNLKYVNLAVMIGGTREFVICNNLSEILLITIDINGKIIKNEFSLSINFEDGNNDVVSIHNNGTVIIIGTNSGNIFILERDGRNKIKNTFQLEKPKTLFEWGKKILGFNFENKSFNHMIKIFQLPYIKEYNNKNMFLYISNNNITLWNNIYLQGKETFEWEENINKMILKDIILDNDISNNSSNSNHLVILDALLIPNEDNNSDGEISVIVLSHFVSENIVKSSRDTKQFQQLWVHKIDFNLDKAAYMSNSVSSYICVNNSHLIDDNHVLFFNKNNDNVVQPKLNYYASPHSSSKSLFYVSYFKLRKYNQNSFYEYYNNSDSDNVSDNSESGIDNTCNEQPENVDDSNFGHKNTTYELFITYINIKSSKRNESDNSFLIKTEKTEYSHELPTWHKVSPSSIMQLGSIKDSDIIFLLQQDGDLLCKIIDSDVNFFDNKIELTIKVLNDIILSNDTKDYISALSKLPIDNLIKSIKDLSIHIDENTINGQSWAGHVPSLLSKFQEIFNSLKDKTIGISRILILISLLKDKINYNSLTVLFDEINLTYQKLHGSMKLCKILYEKKNQLIDINNIKSNEDSISLVDRSRYFTKGIAKAIMLVENAIESSVINIGDDNKLYDISSKGIDIIDDFFSSSKNIVSVFNHIRNILLDELDVLKQKYILVPTVYNLITMFLSITHLSNEEKEQDVYLNKMIKKTLLPLNKNSLICMTEINSFLIELAKILRESINQSVGFEELFINEHSNESKNIYELCRIILKKFEIESNSKKDEYGEKMGNEWKILYNDSKHITVYLLIELGHFDSAYKLSKEFYYFPGLLEINEKDSSYYNSLVEFVAKNKKIKGTNEFNLIEFCFSWFEKANNIPLLLDIGKIDENQLNVFISTRPHIAIIHSLNKKNFSLASELSIKSAKNSGDILLAQSLFSVGKLANIVAENRNNQSTLFSLKQNANKTNITENVNNHLIFLNVQLEIAEYNPDIYSLYKVEHGALLPYNVLINEYIKIFDEDNIESFSIPFSCRKDFDDFNHKTIILENYLLKLLKMIKIYIAEEKIDKTSSLIRDYFINIWSQCIRLDIEFWKDLSITTTFEVEDDKLKEIKDSYLVKIFNKTRELFDLTSEFENIILMNSIDRLKETSPTNLKYIHQIRNVLSYYFNNINKELLFE